MSILSMLGLGKENQQESQETENKPKFYWWISKDGMTLNNYWSDNNCQPPEFNSWEELHLYLKDDRNSLASKLEIIHNLDYNNTKETYSSRHRDGVPMPDYIWKDTTLDRKIRAYCIMKSETYTKMLTRLLRNSVEKKYNANIYYETLVENTDEELFLGICELQNMTTTLLDSDKITLNQRKKIVEGAINFKNSHKTQENCHEYVLLDSLEDNQFDEKFNTEIYEATKIMMLSTKKYINKIYKTFLNMFYKDSSVNNEDKISMIKKYLLDNKNGNDYSEEYLFYLGNINIPSFIEELVLTHFVNASGYNLEHSHPKVFKSIDVSNYNNVLRDKEIPFDLKLKFINATTNPLLLFQGIMSEDIDDRLAALLKSKLETLKIAETKEFLNMLRTLVLNPETAKKRLLTNQEQI